MLYTMLSRANTVRLVVCPDASTYNQESHFKSKSNDCGCDCIFDAKTNVLWMKLHFAEALGW